MPIDAELHKAASTGLTDRFYSRIEAALFYLLFLIASLTTLWIIWAHEFPVMVDLPAFVAGIQAFRDLLFSPDATNLQNVYQLDLLQPYLLPFLSGALLSEVFDVMTATRILISFSALAAVAACWYLTARARADRWWSLAVFATFFGYAYVWGMVSHLVAVPFAFLFIAFCLEASEKPDSAVCAKIFLAGLTVIFCHGLVALFSIFIGGVLLVFNRPRSVKAILPLVVIALLGAVECCMLLQAVSGLSGVYRPSMQWFEWSTRLTSFLASILGMEGDDSAQLVTILFIVAILHAGRCSYVPQWNRRAALAAFTLVILFCPSVFDYKSILYRASSFVVAVGLLAFAVPVSRPQRLMLRGAVVAVIAWQLTVNAARANAFERLMEPFEEILARTDSSASMISTCYTCKLGKSDLPLLLHLSGWYAGRKSGFAAYYFPDTSPWPVRYRVRFRDQHIRGWQGTLPQGSPFDFSQFPRIRYYVFHGDENDLHLVQKQAQNFAHLLMQNGDWALYENLDATVSPLEF